MIEGNDKPAHQPASTLGRANGIRPVKQRFSRPIRLGVLISGGGTTLANFVEQIVAEKLSAEIPLVIASRSDCGGVTRARNFGLHCEIVDRRGFATVADFSQRIFQLCREAHIDLVTLAGFLSLIEVPADFQFRVMNVHPALIPSFCGAGYYGHKVHEAVLARGAKVSGCTVHFADNVYDHGPIIAQTAVMVHEDDTPDSLAARVFAAECRTYPESIRLYSQARLEIFGNRVRVHPEVGSPSNSTETKSNPRDAAAPEMTDL
jgi:formyltetrahydrofolate-dependent phosphoribosylglycinamide formyltransferase